MPSSPRWREHAASTLYPRTSRRAEIGKVLTGYVDDDALRSRPGPRPLAERDRHLVYRATKLPYWFGSHGQLKHRVGTAAASVARGLSLRADVSTRARLTPIVGGWLDFLASGRAVVGCESGSSALDRARRAAQGGLGAARATNRSCRSPRWHRGCRRLGRPSLLRLSPRHLEAALTGTAQILVEGDYDGVLEPDRHYLPVRTDLSDPRGRARADGASRRRSSRSRQPPTRSICLSGRYSYRRLAETVDAALREHGPSASDAGRSALRVARRLAAPRPSSSAGRRSSQARWFAPPPGRAELSRQRRLFFHRCVRNRWRRLPLARTGSAAAACAARDERAHQPSRA